MKRKTEGPRQEKWTVGQEGEAAQTLLIDINRE